MITSLWRRMTRAAARSRRAALRLEGLEERTTPAGIIAAGSAPGTEALVTVYDAATRAQKFTIAPFPGFTGGVNVAVGEVNGDGVPDVIAGAGAGGGPVVNVYSGTDGSFLKSFTVGDDSARAGASVAAADFDRDGLADLVVGSLRNGQPLVQVLRFGDGTVLNGSTPFMGAASVSVAAGDVNADGTPDVIAGAGAGVPSQVLVFNGQTSTTLLTLAPFEGQFLGGVHVAAGDVTGDGRADVFVAAGVTGGPRITVFSGQGGAVLLNFFAYDFGLRDGARVAAVDSDNDGSLDVVTAEGRTGELRAFSSSTVAQLATPAFAGLPAAAPYDTTAPTVTLTSAAANPTRTAPIPFTATFSEGVSGVTAADLTVTNGTVVNFTRVDPRTYTFGVTPAADGAVTVTVAAGAGTDAAGNASLASAPLSRTFDGAAPAVTAAGQTTNDTTPTLTGTVGDATATVSVSVGGQTFNATVSGGTWTATVPTALADGTYTISATATDPAGNTGTATATLVIDTVAPGATVSSTAPEPTNTSPIPFRVTFDEDVTGFAVTDLTVSNGTASGFTAVDGHTYDFNVTPSGSNVVVSVSVAAGVATDAAGNANTASNTLFRTFDTGAVGLTANSLTTNDTTPTLTGTVDDSTATVTVTVNGETVTATVTGNDWVATLTTPLPDGTYDIQVNATDAATNTGTLTVTGGLVVDTLAPTVSGVTVDPAATADGAYTTGTVIDVQVTFSEPVTVNTTGGTPTLALNSGGTAAYVSGSGTATLDFRYTVAAGDTSADLDYTGTAALALNGGTIRDAAGNDATLTLAAPGTAGSLGASRDIVIDTAAPAAPAITGIADDTGSDATDGITSDTTLIVSGTAEAGSTVEVFSDGTSVGTTTVGPGGDWSLDLTGTPLAAGTYSFTATATDAAGNTGAASTAFAVTIDTVAPTVASITASPPTGAFRAGDSIDLTVTFSEPVTLAGGTLSLTLDTGAVVALTQGGDPAVFTGTYTVGAGENSPDLNSVSLALSAGATLTDAAGNAADLTIPAGAALATTASIVIDTTDPTTTIAPTSSAAVTGSADDGTGSGVQVVRVSIFDPTAGTTGLYYDESTGDFTSAVELFFGATDDSAGGDWSAWSYAIPAGSYTVRAEVTDVAGNQAVIGPVPVAVS